MEDYMKAKKNADKHLKNSNLNYTIVRSGTLNNSEGNGKIELSEKLNKEGEISRADVAQTLVKALHDDAPNNATFEILQGETLIGEAMNNIQMNELNMSVN